MRQVDALAAGGVDHAVQDLVELDRGMREDLIALTNIKVSMLVGNRQGRSH